MPVNMMGFKKVSKMPSSKRRSIYDPLLVEVHKAGGLYVLDTQDKRRAYSLSSTLHALIKKRGYDNLRTGVRETTVYLERI